MTLPMLAKTEEGKEGKGAQKANTRHWFRQCCGQQEAWCGVGMARQQFKMIWKGWNGEEENKREEWCERVGP